MPGNANLGAELARPNGYADYDDGLVWTRERHGAFWTGARVPSTIPNDSGRFPALEALAARLDGLPAGLAVVLLRPSVAAPALPEPGNELDRSESACRAATARLAEGRPSGRVVDCRLDRPEIHVPENFTDSTHYRSAIARSVEADVAAAIRFPRCEALNGPGRFGTERRPRHRERSAKKKFHAKKHRAVRPWTNAKHLPPVLA